MKTPDIIAAISATIALASLVVATVQVRDNRRRKRSEAELLAEVQERLRTAVTAAAAGAESADLIVQRAKVPGTTVRQLQDIARGLRGTLGLLVQQLRDEDRRLASFDGPLFSSEKPARPKPKQPGP